MNTIPYGRQDINQEDIDQVISVLRSDFLTQGPMVPQFENAVATYCGVDYAIAVNSATSALHIACLALGVGKGDIVWTSPISFVASANCALYCGATVDFVDIDPLTYNMSVGELEKKLEVAEKNGKLPKVVIPVHLCGQSCDMAGIYSLGVKYGFRIIEDASHAIGGKYRSEPVGNCRYSDITVFSFHPVKIITTGEGGMAVTNHPNLARQMRLLRSHGITADPSDMDIRPENEIWNYQQINLGFNYRMTDIQAALGLSQIKRLDAFVMRRHEIADIYTGALANLPLILPWQSPDAYSSYHLFIVRLKLEKIKPHQKTIYEILRSKGILVNLHYIPIYLQPQYQRLGFSYGYCLNAEQYFHEAFSLPIYAALKNEELKKIIRSIGESLILI